MFRKVRTTRLIWLVLATLATIPVQPGQPLTQIQLVAYYSRDVLNAFTLYFGLALLGMWFELDLKIAFFLAAFFTGAYFEVLQGLGISFLVFPVGSYDPWDFFSYAIGAGSAMLVDWKYKW